MAQLLRTGSQGPEVRAVQDVLNFHIRRLEPLKVDGIFGPRTDARVREFQRANSLQVDGIVGPKTRALLFEESVVPLTLFLMPQLTLTFPGPNPRRLQPPQLIPPLQLPGLLPFDFRLLSDSTALLPTLGTPANALNLQFKVPSRLDPVDPNVAARQNIVQLIDNLPLNSKFKAFVIGKIPDPANKISPPTPGFKWGLEPLFNPFDPTGFGAEGNASFTVRVLGGGRPEDVNMVFGAWGDGKFNLDFTNKRGQSRPKVEAEGKVFVGVQGTF